MLRKIQNSSKEGGAPLRTAVTDRGTQTNFTKPLVITVRGGGGGERREGGRAAKLAHPSPDPPMWCVLTK